MMKTVFIKHKFFYVVLGLMVVAMLVMALLNIYTMAFLCGGLLLITYIISVESLTINDRGIKLDAPAFFGQQQAREIVLANVSQLQIKPVWPSVYMVMIRLNDGQQIKVRMLTQVF